VGRPYLSPKEHDQMNRNRREFLADVGKGMLIASVGSTVAAELGLSRAFALDGSDRLSFGSREPLVALMQDTPANKLLPVVVDKLKSGTSLGDLVTAAALANARTFGGQDYTGYHSFMALLPSYQMSRELPPDHQALPVLKVLHRNTRRMQECGGHEKEVLHSVKPGELPKDRPAGEVLREATRHKDFQGAEQTLAALAQGPIDEAYNHLQFTVQDEIDVHRVVLAWRSWAILELAGKENAHTLLRQSVRFCCNEEHGGWGGVRAVLPKLLDEHKLMGRSLGNRKPDDAWVARLAETIYGSNPASAAAAAAAALAEGMAPECIGEAISLAANKLVLCDPGRTQAQAQPGKPAGSIHGASVGVHASDSANAWRNIARVSNPRNTMASLIVGAYHTAGQTGGQHKQPRPTPEQLEKITTKDADKLLAELAGAIQEKNQDHACALVHRYGELGQDARRAFDVLLRFAVSEDGALHAEKYYRTVTEEFAATRPAFRWRHLAALARVTASEYGFPAPGYAEACKLLKL
jgi:hypothetical protein